MSIFSANVDHAKLPKYVLDRKEYVSSKYVYMKGFATSGISKAKTNFLLIKSVLKEVRRKAKVGLFLSPALLEKQIWDLTTLSNAGPNIGAITFCKLLLKSQYILTGKMSLVDFMLQAGGRHKLLTNLVSEMTQFIGLPRFAYQKLQTLVDGDYSLKDIDLKSAVITEIIQNIPTILRENLTINK